MSIEICQGNPEKVQDGKECNPSATLMNQHEKFCKEDGAAKYDERL